MKLVDAVLGETRNRRVKLEKAKEGEGRDVIHDKPERGGVVMETIGESRSAAELVERLEAHPAMKERIVRLLDLVENVTGEVKRADDAEQRAMGRDILHTWGQRLAETEGAATRKGGGVVHQAKKLRWHSTFGDIEVIEQIYRSKADGTLRRPFVAVAGVCQRGYSRALQRAITDFGADVPFGRVGGKLKEHYGIDIPLSAAASVTYRHARALARQDIVPQSAAKIAPLTLIAQSDGSMIPVVQPVAADAAGDKRKHRALVWKEARLSLVRRPEQVEPVCAVTLGDAQAAGEDLKRLALGSGLNRHTHVHGLGDGAPWIADQMERQFGAQACYLIDFYHLCDYLAAAANICDPVQPGTWLAAQKARFKAGQVSAVMDALAPYVEPESACGDQPVRDAWRYIANRPDQFDYPRAIAANLPIGSGEVESAHRSVIQKRLKLPGAWWKPANAQAMLNLRCLRANHLWHDFWLNAA